MSQRDQQFAHGTPNRAFEQAPISGGFNQWALPRRRSTMSLGRSPVHRPSDVHSLASAEVSVQETSG